MDRYLTPDSLSVFHPTVAGLYRRVITARCFLFSVAPRLLSTADIPGGIVLSTLLGRAPVALALALAIGHWPLAGGCAVVVKERTTLRHRTSVSEWPKKEK